MDFSLSDDHRMIQDMISRFVRDTYDFERRQSFVESDIGFSQETWTQMAELGVIATVLPEEVGGFGGTGLDIMVVMQELGRGLVIEPYLATAILGAGILADVGGQESLLEKIIAGEEKVTFAHYAPGRRYNADKLDAKAVKSGDSYSLTGQKSLVLHAGAADHLIVSAELDGSPALFLVAADADGLTIRDYTTQDGGRAGEVTMENASATLIAQDDVAGKAISNALARGTLAVGAEAIGVMEVARDMTVDYLKTRTQFGVNIGKFQALQHRMVDACLEIEQARSLVMLAAAKFEDDASERDKLLSAMKVKIGQAGRLVGEESIQMHGGIGMTWEYALGHYAKRLTMIDHQFGDVDYHLKRFMAA